MIDRKQYGVIVYVDREEITSTQSIVTHYRISWRDGNGGEVYTCEHWVDSQMLGYARSKEHFALSIYKEFEDKIRIGTAAAEDRWESVSPFLKKALLP
jgi:hypothetical protein